MINYALIMAAGRGLRMMPLTQYVPKPMIEVNGSTLISKSIKELKKQIPVIGITVGYKGPELAKHVLEEDVSMIFNTNKQGNAWWIFNTLMRFLNEPVLVLTCDNVVELDLPFLINNYEQLNSPACMVVPVHPVPGIEGDFIIGENGKVTALSRKYVSDIYCSGIQIMNPQTINKLISNLDNFSELWEALISINQLSYSAIYPKNWYTINTLHQLEALKITN
jgi:MurNAc alpha-1-phosphate uridylyltransferase